MTWPCKFADPSRFDEFVSLKTDRVGEGDAARQRATVLEVLRRLADQPGVIVGDEVGMGKTFVALATAAAAVRADVDRRPVVVMAPPSLVREERVADGQRPRPSKWNRDLDVFNEYCLQKANGFTPLKSATANHAIDFFRLLDDADAERPDIIFLSHGAFHTRGLDAWLKLAIIRQASRGLHLGERRKRLPILASELLKHASRYDDSRMYAKLLAAPVSEWKTIINRAVGADSLAALQDDPVPEAVATAIEQGDIDWGDLREALLDLPLRRRGDNVARARKALAKAIDSLWPKILIKARFSSPLLILDEAHHLRHGHTRLASLFASEDARQDANMLGMLNGTFERHLFLTATPFQLGPQELVNVVRRFGSAAWTTLPAGRKEVFSEDCRLLESALMGAQRALFEFGARWRRMPSDGSPLIQRQWIGSTDGGEVPAEHAATLEAFVRARHALQTSEQALRPWVIRHLRSRTLPGNATVLRRQRYVGVGLVPGQEASSDGLSIPTDDVLPFLLATRAHIHLARAGRSSSHNRRTFFEGLFSSFEAYRHTRGDEDTSEVDVLAEAGGWDRRTRHYIETLGQALPEEKDYGHHPKMQALVQRTLQLWRNGEKVLVFCFYVQTGAAIERHLREAIDTAFWEGVTSRLGLDRSAAEHEILNFGKRFDDGAAMARLIDDWVDGQTVARADLSDEERLDLKAIVRRFVRTPSFLGRYFDVSAKSDVATLDNALAVTDGSGHSLQRKLQDFLEFISKRCSPLERGAYLSALKNIDTNDLTVRRISGATHQQQRQNFMLGFNSPFAPDVLVASGVIAEGVDLHLYCRHVVHYDLTWNPSELEQRTGRIDRIGALAERATRSIKVYLPYLAATQDEKQYRVVIDRERWFQILLGDTYSEPGEDEEDRLPLPEALRDALAIDLSVYRTEACLQ